MSNKNTYNFAFLLLTLGTICLAFENKSGGVGTGIVVFCMFLGYTTGSAPRD